MRRPFWTIVFCMFVGGFLWTPVQAQVPCINFETLPDTTIVDTQFSGFPWYVTFSLPFAPPGLGPRSAHVGGNNTAFVSAPAVTNPACGITVATSNDMIRVVDQPLVGCVFLTDSQSSADSAQTLRIDYSQNFPTQVSGDLLDIDNNEAWEIRAYGPDLETLVSEGPGLNPVTISTSSPFPAGVDGSVVPWQINLSSPIHRIEFVYVGSGAGVGLAFDNFCVNSLPCTQISNETVECDSTGTGDKFYTFDITNLSGVVVHYIILTPLSAFDITPNVLSVPVELPTPLQPGETLSGVQVTLQGVALSGSSEQISFVVSLHDSLVGECCSVVQTLDVDPCCIETFSESTACVGGGDFDYTFSITNGFSAPLHHVYLLGGSPASFSTNHFALGTPVAPGGNAGPFTTTISGVAPGDTVCFLISVHDSLLNECCSIEKCVVSPCTTMAASPPTGVVSKPANIELRQNHPNPFNPSTTIEYTLRSDTHVRLDVYDASGRLVARLVDDVRASGTYFVTWKGRDRRGTRVSTGVYFSRLSAGGETLTKKMVLLK